jgi:hypothetical protein
MRVRDLVILPTGSRTGIFTAPQSLVAFALGTSIVTTMSRAARTLGRVDAESTLVAFVTACALGAAIVAATVSDTEARPKSAAAWALSLLIAILNTLILYAAAIGIEKF